MTHLFLLVGTYTNGRSKGIYSFRFDIETGDSEYCGEAEVENPSYLWIDDDNNYIYAVSENEDRPSYANSFAFDNKSGKIKILNRQLVHGDAPCYIISDNALQRVVTANYGGGSITVFGINMDGTLTEAEQVIGFEGKGVDPERQDKPHIHCVGFSPDKKYLFVSDLGTDSIYRFPVNKSGIGSFLTEEEKEIFKVPDGSGPRHFLFHPSGKYMYLINELGGTVIGYWYDEGNIRQFQIIKADMLNAQGSGDIAITPDGKFLYASNRLVNDGIAVFSINADTGNLSKIDYQNTKIHPRNLAVTPNGKFLLVANKDSNSIEIYKIDPATGLLNNINKDIIIDQPVCLKFTV